jgi:hypothetical protein
VLEVEEHATKDRHEVREADADSLRRDTCHDVRYGQDSDEDSGGLLALHARRFYTDLRIVR